jgi:hypothetical protein
VEKHTESLGLYCQGQGDVLIAGRLAKKGVQPTYIRLSSSNREISCEVLTTFLTGEQHLPLFKRVTHLLLHSGLSHDLLQVKAFFRTCCWDQGCAVSATVCLNCVGSLHRES